MAKYLLYDFIESDDEDDIIKYGIDMAFQGFNGTMTKLDDDTTLKDIEQILTRLKPLPTKEREKECIQKQPI